MIDISNPRLPPLRSAMPSGFIETGVPGAFGLPEPQEAGIGHTASCIRDRRFAYLAGTSRGIQIVDLRDPDNPKKAGRFVPAITGLATHDVQVDKGGLAWIAGGDGTAAYDMSDPLRPRMVMRTDESIKNSGQLGFPGPDPVFGLGGEGETPIDLIHHNSLRLSKRLVAITERPSSTTSWRARVGRPSRGSVTGLWSAHYFDERAGRVAIGWYKEGTRFLDVRDPAGIRQVGYWVPTKGEIWSVYFPPTDRSGAIVYALDCARDRRAPLRPRRPARAAARPSGAPGCATAPARRARAPAAPGSAARPTSASSAACRAAGTPRRRSPSCQGSSCRGCRPCLMAAADPGPADRCRAAGAFRRAAPRSSPDARRSVRG